MSDLSITLDEAYVGTAGYRDLTLVQGDLVLTSDVSPSAQATDPTLQMVCQNILWFLGEWFLDTSGGTGWFQHVLVKGATQQNIDALLQERILSTPGVAILTDYKSTPYPEQRLYRISFSIKTTAGALLSQTLPVSLGIGG